MSPYWVVERSREERVNQILKDYGDSPKTDLLASLQRVSRKMGPQNAKTAAEFIQAGELGAAVHLFLDYYDKFYDGGFAKRLGENKGIIAGNQLNYPQIAKEILKKIP